MLSKRPFVNVDLNKNNANLHPTITNNINITQKNMDKVDVKTDDLPQYPIPTEENNAVDFYINIANNLERENRALRLILQIRKENPLMLSDVMIAHEEKLHDLLMILCEAEDVDINTEDYFECDCGCKNTEKYRKVSAIYVKKDGENMNLKYSFGSVNKLLVDEKISVKFVI